MAEDIRQNGLINPPVVNKEYQLLAGERRLRACKLLGWPQIEVRMMDTRDAEHELNIEISENDVRKGFTKSERVDYIKRLLRIEQAKAKERQGEHTSASNNTEVQRSDEATAKQFDMSATTMRRELFISDNSDLLDPADFADWDEGKLSTNKAFQRIKAKIWIIENQFGRRNLSTYDRATLALQLEPLYASEAKRRQVASLKQGTESPVSQNSAKREPFHTDDQLAKIAGTSRDTIRKVKVIETEQTFAKVGIYADQRIGELLREMPKSNRWKSNSDASENDTKADALQEAGIARSQAYDLEKLAANPDLVELVIANAEISGTIPSRAQVLTAIKEREQAEKDADMARKVAYRLKAERDEAREEVAALERQNDQCVTELHGGSIASGTPWLARSYL